MPYLTGPERDLARLKNLTKGYKKSDYVALTWTSSRDVMSQLSDDIIYVPYDNDVEEFAKRVVLEANKIQEGTEDMFFRVAPPGQIYHRWKVVNSDSYPDAPYLSDDVIGIGATKSSSDNKVSFEMFSSGTSENKLQMMQILMKLSALGVPVDGVGDS